LRVASALVNKGIVLGELDRSAEEIEVYDQVVTCFGDDPTPAVREQVARALVNKGITLGSGDVHENDVLQVAQPGLSRGAHHSCVSVGGLVLAELAGAQHHQQPARAQWACPRADQASGDRAARRPRTGRDRSGEHHDQPRRGCLHGRAPTPHPDPWPSSRPAAPP
jgi:hypothetical protein